MSTPFTPVVCRERRLALGWTAAELARRAGNIGPSTVKHYETYRGSPLGRWYLNRLDQTLTDGEEARCQAPLRRRA